MKRAEMVEFLVRQDIADIIQAHNEDDYEFLNNVLTGEGWKPYNQLTNKQIEEEYEERKEQ